MQPDELVTADSESCAAAACLLLLVREWRIESPIRTCLHIAMSMLHRLRS